MPRRGRVPGLFWAETWYKMNAQNMAAYTTARVHHTRSDMGCMYRSTAR